MNCINCSKADRPKPTDSFVVGLGKHRAIELQYGCEGPCHECEYCNREDGCEILSGLAECKPHEKWCVRGWGR